MPNPNIISLLYYGGDADDNRLNLYDASQSYEGLARTLAIIGHYYLTQDFIYQAPSSKMPLYLVPPEAGSFKQTIMAAVVGGIVSAPFSVFAYRLLDNWIPSQADEQQKQIIELLREQNELLRKSSGLPKKETENEAKQVEAVDQFIEKNEKDVASLRSVTSQSFKRIFRPIETGSAKQMGIIGGLGRVPTTVVDQEVLARIEADYVDPNAVTVMGVVNSFTRKSKRGSIFSRDYNENIRIEYEHKDAMPRGDDFSWSQLTGQPIRMTGRFIRYFDGKVKKLWITYVERVTDQADIDDYFHHDRAPLPL